LIEGNFRWIDCEKKDDDLTVAAGGAKTYSSSTTSLAKKTSNQIVKTITDYFVRAGWWVG
jgi:hypothetical protein